MSDLSEFPCVCCAGAGFPPLLPGKLTGEGAGVGVEAREAWADRCAERGMEAAVLALRAAGLDDSVLWTRPFRYAESGWRAEAGARRALVLAVLAELAENLKG